MAVRGKPTLPWLLLLVAVTAVLPTNADYNDSDYMHIRRRVATHHNIMTVCIYVLYSVINGMPLTPAPCWGSSVLMDVLE